MGITPGFNCVYPHNHESGPTKYLLSETTMLSLLTTRNLGRSYGEAENFHFQRPMIHWTLGKCPTRVIILAHHSCAQREHLSRFHTVDVETWDEDLPLRLPRQFKTRMLTEPMSGAFLAGAGGGGDGGRRGRGMVCFLVQSSLLWADCSHLSGFSVLLCGLGHTTQVCAVLLIWAQIKHFE